ncbi:hypothetical protein KI387_005594, partial [Taxus chinensis]
EMMCIAGKGFIDDLVDYLMLAMSSVGLKDSLGTFRGYFRPLLIAACVYQFTHRGILLPSLGRHLSHLESAVVWDKQMARAQFNWWWYHTPTYAPYNVEGTFLPLILASTGAVQNARTAAIVLQSLTPNAQSVFKILAEYQLAHPEEQ